MIDTIVCVFVCYTAKLVQFNLQAMVESVLEEQEAQDFLTRNHIDEQLEEYHEEIA